MKAKNLTLGLTRGAAIAALYVILTYLSALFGLSSGVIQFRISEALCILPIFFPEAVPGLFIGCLIANLLTGAVFWDIIFGAIATLLGALGARFLKSLPKKMKWLTTIPTVLANLLIVPFVLVYAYGATDAVWFILLTIFIGEAVCAGIGGSALYYFLNSSKALRRYITDRSR